MRPFDKGADCTAGAAFYSQPSSSKPPTSPFSLSLADGELCPARERMSFFTTRDAGSFLSIGPQRGYPLILSPDDGEALGCGYSVAGPRRLL